MEVSMSFTRLPSDPEDLSFTFRILTLAQKLPVLASTGDGCVAFCTPVVLNAISTQRIALADSDFLDTSGDSII